MGELRILHVEDSASDAALVRDALRRAGISCRIDVVDTRETYLAALTTSAYDVVLSDRAMPAFDPISALRLLRERDALTPFILVSGAIGEEAAIDAIRAGVTDYVLKHRLDRLPSCVRRAVAEAHDRRERAKAEQELRRTEERFAAERGRLEAQLRQAQRMEAIGTLAGGIAHDFNNLLTSVLGFTELLLEETPVDDPRRHDLEMIQQAGNQGAALTRQLLAFSRRQILELSIIDLHDVTREIERLLRRVIGENIRLTVASDPDLGCIKADRGQIEQVLMNLAVNARDAMPRGGQLTIETRNVHLDEDYVESHSYVVAGPHVMLAVTDTGSGMSQDVRARVFEPFFTTKPRGKGTGLGLSTVYGIVKQVGGSIEVYSELGQGTAFEIYFPRVDEPASRTSHAIPDTPATGDGTIVLVEDEAGLRALVARVLTQRGYHLTQAGSAEEALALLSSHTAPPDLLLTDTVLPGMSGPELAARLAERWPGLRVLLVSGYTDDTVVRHGLVGSGHAFLQKPFSPGALARKVQEVLGRDDAAGGSSD